MKVSVRTYVAVSATNLLFLGIGSALGFYLSGSPVRAQSSQAVEEIAPGLTTGSFAAHTILASRIATDSIQVRGYDLVKLHENTLNLIASRHFAPAEAQAVIEKSKADPVLRIKAPETKPPADSSKDKGKDQ